LRWWITEDLTVQVALSELYPKSASISLKVKLLHWLLLDWYRSLVDDSSADRREAAISGNKKFSVGFSETPIAFLRTELFHFPLLTERNGHILISVTEGD
jgi:hypothetical protein